MSRMADHAAEVVEVPVYPATTLDPNIIARFVTDGDLKGLSQEQRVSYYNYRCQQAGLDPAAKPFDLLSLNGKLVLYANATCTQQLCANRKLTVEIVRKGRVEELYVVCARVTDKEGRSTDNMGAVPLGGKKADDLANALMKATTKAIRRPALAHCGVGMLDETEPAPIAGAKPVPLDVNPETLSFKVSPYPDEMASVDPEIAQEFANGIKRAIENNEPDKIWDIHNELRTEVALYAKVGTLLNTKEKAALRAVVNEQNAKVAHVE